MKIKKCDHGMGSQTLQTEHPRSVSSNLDFSSILSCWRRKQSEPTSADAASVAKEIRS